MRSQTLRDLTPGAARASLRLTQSIVELSSLPSVSGMNAATTADRMRRDLGIIAAWVEALDPSTDPDRPE